MSPNYPPWVGIEAYDVPPSVQRSGRYFDPAPHRAIALAAARNVYAATGNPNIGYRETPWGSEITVFGTFAGLRRWANEQGHDTDVWYAAAFNLLASSLPTSELAR